MGIAHPCPLVARALTLSCMARDANDEGDRPPPPPGPPPKFKYTPGGLIVRRWSELGGERGILGPMASDEMATHDKVGTFQQFANGIIVWHRDVGAFEVYGAILERYSQLGGSTWGYPTTGETAAANGGRFNHFRNLETGGDLSIYWSEQTGAHEIYGYIRSAWADDKWENGVVGYPTSGELVTHDNVGRFQTFQNGIYVWHPNVGAFEVHGSILERYSQLGGSAFGYPTTDESPAANGARFNHFVDPASGAQKSIYWTPKHGAHEVYGLNRQRWEQLGWERSNLGFPTGSEVPWPEGGPGSTQQSFEGGQMLYSAPRNQSAANPSRWHDDLNRTGVRGEVNVTVHLDGTARFDGWARAVKQDSYEFIVHVLLKNPNNLALAFSASGKIYGDLQPGKERKDFSENTSAPVDFWAFQNATLQIEKNFRSKLFGAIGDLFEAAVKWFAGAAVIASPGAALLLLGGTAAVTAVAGGSVASGMRIVAGTLWLAGPYGTAIALAADGLARLATKERDLSQAEYDLAKLVFKESLPPRTQIRISDAIGGGGRPFTFPRSDDKMVISVGEKFYDDVRPYQDEEESKTYGELLIHELTHVWQYHNNAAKISYIGDAIWARVRDDYDPGQVLDEPWDSFGLEEQGSIVDTWFSTYYKGPGSADGKGTAADDFGLRSAAAVGDQAFRFIQENIRVGRN